MMDQLHHVIIGSGISGVTAAETIRKYDRKGRVTILSSEFDMPYRRYALPKYVSGELSEAKLLLHNSSFYEKKDLKLRLGQEIQGVDFENRRIFLEHKEVVSYDRLLIASGSSAHIPVYLEHLSGLIHTLRTLDDARKLRKEIKTAREVFIIGGTLASLELMNALLIKKVKVTLLLNKEGFWPLSLSESDHSEIVKRLSRKADLVLLVEDDLESIRQEEDRLLIRTTKGTLTISNIIVGSYGYRPELTFLDHRIIEIDRGVLVDEHLRSSVADAWAAGDCAQPYHRGMKSYYVNHGWPNARFQGRIAGLNMADKPTRYDTLKVNPFDIEGLEVGTPWWKRF